MLRGNQNEATRDKVLAALQRYWQVPEPREEGRRTAAEQVETVARQALDAMLTRPFRISKLPAAEEYEQLLAHVRHWVARGKSIRITLGYAPMKNPRTVPHRHADWAEFFALGHLCAWHNKVHAVYPPGLRIKIVFDDSTVAMANRVDPQAMTSLYPQRGPPDPQHGLPVVHRGHHAAVLVRLAVPLRPLPDCPPPRRRWEADPANQPVLEKMLEFARRNLDMPEDLAPEEKERRYRAASHRYRVYWEALQLSGFSRLGHSLVGMYLDGSQHHIRQPAALHLASVGKEQVTQPWQGEGALVDNGKGQLVPLVLTGGRRAAHDDRGSRRPGPRPGQGLREGPFVPRGRRVASRRVRWVLTAHNGDRLLVGFDDRDG